MQIHLIVVGKLKDAHWKEAEAEYLKRLQPFFAITIHELREVSFTEKDPREVVIAKEAVKINEVLQKIRPGLVVALEENGNQYSSPEFAKKLRSWTELHQSIALVIGGPLGLDPSIVGAARQTLSLSRLTFTHQMARVLLTEQLYRAAMISAGRRYHY